MGNLTRDPDYRQLSSGQSVCRLGLASNRQFKNKQTGMMVQEVCFVDIDVWGAQADSCNQYLQKGRAVLVEGRLKLDTWVDNDGQKKSRHSVVADRVTFLPTASSQDTSFNFQDNSNTTENGVEKGNIKAATAVKEAKESKASDSDEKKKETNSGEIDLKDQEPFEDDLPF